MAGARPGGSRPFQPSLLIRALFLAALGSSLIVDIYGLDKELDRLLQLGYPLPK